MVVNYGSVSRGVPKDAGGVVPSEPNLRGTQGKVAGDPVLTQGELFASRIGERSFGSLEETESRQPVVDKPNSIAMREF